MAGFPPWGSARVFISLALKRITIPINIENSGILLKLSPAKIIASKKGIPIRFTNVLEELFPVISTSNQDRKFTGT